MDGDDDLIGGVRKSFDAPPYSGLCATWWQDQAFGFGLDANHDKVYTSDKYKNYAGYDRLWFTDGLNSVTVNVYRHFPDAWRNITPYIGPVLGSWCRMWTLPKMACAALNTK